MTFQRIVMMFFGKNWKFSENFENFPSQTEKSPKKPNFTKQTVHAKLGYFLATFCDKNGDFLIKGPENTVHEFDFEPLKLEKPLELRTEKSRVCNQISQNLT